MVEPFPSHPEDLMTHGWIMDHLWGNILQGTSWSLCTYFHLLSLLRLSFLDCLFNPKNQHKTWCLTLGKLMTSFVILGKYSIQLTGVL
jgi:hypothetical protein